MATVIKSAAKRAPTAIAMMNMGGPSTLPEVQDFLTNLFTDPEIIPMGKVQPFVGPWVAKNRTPKITDQYAAIGGGSPIRKWTNIQGKEMCKILDEIRPETAPHKHYVFFRYANPLTEESLKQMKADGVTRAIAFSQYPQWSCTTTGSSMNQLWRELDRLDMTDDFQWSLIDRWNTHPGYISAVANRVRQGLEQFAPEDRDKVVIMFSAHSVPMKVVYKGDPYTKEIASTAERVMEKLGVGNSHILAWQSKVGYLPWMGPSTSNVIKGLGAQGRKHVLTVPIAFTSDHIETLFEIDIEYAEEAQEAGIEQFKRCPSLNDEPLLFSAMADIVKTHLDTNTLHSPQYPLNCPECTNPMCRTIKNPIKPYTKFIQPKNYTGKEQEANTAVALAHTHRSGARQVAMLSSRERLQERQGQHAPPRHEYLQQLVDEYQRSAHVLRKEEIVANLANFAYDPINYASLAQLQIMDLFLDILDADHEETRRVQEKEQEQEQDGKRKHTEEPLTRKHHQLLAEFAIGGVCNCITDPVLQYAFIAGDGFPLVEPYIWSVDDISEAMTGKRHASRLNTVLSALSIAYFLLDSSAFAVVSHEQLRNHIRSLELHANTQIANTATAFRTRYEEILLYSTPVAMPIAPPLPPPLPPGPPPPLSPPRT